MKIVIATHVFSKVLNEVSKALSNKSTIPILSEIYVNASEEGLVLMAGDGTTTMMSIIDLDEFELVESGSITLPGKMFADIVRKLSGDITIDTKDTTAIIKSKNSNFELVGMDGDEYPQIPEVKGKVVTVDGDTLRGILEKSIYAASNDESSMILTGVKFEFSEGGIKLIATNRHRLALVKKDIDCNFELSIVIGQESLSKMNKVIGKEVELSIEPNRLIAKTEGYTFYSRVLEGEYPNVSNIMTTEYKSEVTANRNEMLKAIDRVMIIAKDGNSDKKIALINVTNEIEISSKASNKKVTETVKRKKINGNEFKFSANLEYIEDALKVIRDEEVTIGFTGELSPIFITGNGSDEEIHMVLPYRTTN